MSGSCTKITTQNSTYLFELGMTQEYTVLENYKTNNKLLRKLKIKDIEYIIIGHFHIDHIGLIPALYENDRCNATIVVPEKSIPIIKEMWLDSAYINQRDIERLNLKSERNYKPLYSEYGVSQALQHIKEIPSHTIYDLNDELSLRYSNAGHVLLSKQTELFLKQNGHTSKILMTSDLGNVSTQNSRVFVENFEPVKTANIVIGESTYSGNKKGITQDTYKKDVEKIKAIVNQYCIDNNNRVLFPTFALDRTPYILWILYSLFGKQEDFSVPVIIDSPLANRLLDCYSDILDDERKSLFDEMMSWKNIIRIVESEDSKAAIAESGAKIILSCSGMLTAGRSVKWVQSILPNASDVICFLGYAGEGTLAHKIKYEKDNKTININGKPYKNKANIIDLHSFSGHMQRDDLINYYSTINADKIYLVHGNKNDKLTLKEDLEKVLAQKCKTTRIISTNKGTKITI